jgi:hypothetical protein
MDEGIACLMEHQLSQTSARLVTTKEGEEGRRMLDGGKESMMQW